MSFHTSTPLDPSFEKDIKNLHLLYDYAATNPDTKAPEKWRYEMYFASPSLVVYSIHGGPMAGRKNYQAASYQCIRPGELWQCNWLEETGTIVSMVYDITQQTITSMIAFSKGHWEHPQEAHGDKREKEDFMRWRGLSRIGGQAERVVLCERAEIVERFWGWGDFEKVEEGVETL